MGGIVQQLNNLSLTAEHLSVVIIALNEEQNLSALLPAMPKGAEIILVDSHSSDKTAEVARSFGAKVINHPFTGFASQKNFAASQATRAWTLMLDADERPDDELWRSIINITTTNQNIAANLPRKLVFNGRKMKFGRTHDFVLRLFKTGSFEYQKEIHEVPISKTGAQQINLSGILWHYSYKNLDDYFAKFNRYTSLMAEDRLQRGARLPMKAELALRLPIDFMSRYFFRLGFLDGYEGFVWAALGSFYGFIKYVKALEKKSGISK